MNQKFFLGFTLIAIVAAGLIFWLSPSGQSDQKEKTPVENATEVVMYKNAGCMCCDKWAAYLEEHGYEVTVHESMNTSTIKDENKVPDNMRSCHTAFIDGYVVEGHVPVEDINRLLTERPEVIGISAPGMPESSPGMNTAINVPYDVYQFDDTGNATLYASH